MILGLIGASAESPVPDGTSLIVKQVYNKVYDESRDKTMETFVQKYPENKLD